MTNERAIAGKIFIFFFLLLSSGPISKSGPRHKRLMDHGPLSYASHIKLIPPCSNFHSIKEILFLLNEIKFPSI